MSRSGRLFTPSSLLVPFALSCASTPVTTTQTNSACGTSGPKGNVPFGLAQAQSSLLESAMAAADCSERTAASSGRAIVHFSPAGCVLNVTLEVEGPDWTPADTECVAKAFYAARVEPYSGAPVAVRRPLKPTR